MSQGRRSCWNQLQMLAYLPQLAPLPLPPASCHYFLFFCSAQQPLAQSNNLRKSKAFLKLIMLECHQGHFSNRALEDSACPGFFPESPVWKVKVCCILEHLRKLRAILQVHYTADSTISVLITFDSSKQVSTLMCSSNKVHPKETPLPFCQLPK